MGNFSYDFSISTKCFLSLSHKTNNSFNLLLQIFTIHIYTYIIIYHDENKTSHISYGMVLDIIRMCTFWHLCKSIHFKVGCILLYGWLHQVIGRNIVEVIGHNKVPSLICIHLVRHCKLSAKEQLSLLSYAYTNYYYYHRRSEFVLKVISNTILMW